MCTPIFGILFYRIGLHSTLQYVFLRHCTSIILKVGSFQNSTDDSHTYLLWKTRLTLKCSKFNQILTITLSSPNLLTPTLSVQHSRIRKLFTKRIWGTVQKLLWRVLWDSQCHLNIVLLHNNRSLLNQRAILCGNWRGHIQQ